jgi:hypothetical protein
MKNEASTETNPSLTLLLSNLQGEASPLKGSSHPWMECVMYGRTYRRRCDARRAAECANRAQEEANTSG